jgi:hypothetical protein
MKKEMTNNFIEEKRQKKYQVGPPSSLSMILKIFIMYDLNYNSRTKKNQRKKNSKWGHSKELSIIQKKICSMLEEKKNESGFQ